MKQLTEAVAELAAAAVLVAAACGSGSSAGAPRDAAVDTAPAIGPARPP